FDAGYAFTPDDGKSFPFRDRGIGIPTLAQVLAAFPDTRVNIEIKDGRVQERVWESIVDAGATGRVLVAAGRSRDRSFFDRRPVATSAGEEELRMFIAQLRIGTILHVAGVDAFQIPDRWNGREIATAGFIAAARRRNVPVHVWTV